MNVVISITKQEWVKAILPKGNYIGFWENYVIKVVYKEETYYLKTPKTPDIGIMIRVVVSITDKEWSFEELQN